MIGLMNHPKAFAVAALLAFAPGVAALELQEAKDRLGLEYARCAGWYFIMREVASRSFPEGDDRDAAIARQQRLADLAYDRSADATSHDLAQDRLQGALRAMHARMRHSFENLPAIADEYAYPCKALMDSPDARLRYWLEQK